MKWPEIVFNLLGDPMIECCGMDGLWDANRTLCGLLGMCQIMNLSDEFICEAINASINARNNYCFNRLDELPYVIIENGEYIWEDCLQ